MRSVSHMPLRSVVEHAAGVAVVSVAGCEAQPVRPGLSPAATVAVVLAAVFAAAVVRTARGIGR